MVAKNLVLASFASLVLSASPLALAAPSGATAAKAEKASTEKSQHPVKDSAITGKVKAALLAKSELKSLHIHVETKDGLVTLTGSVPEQAQADMATEVARGIDGVTDVNNSLQVKPKK